MDFLPEGKILQPEDSSSEESSSEVSSPNRPEVSTQTTSGTSADNPEVSAEFRHLVLSDVDSIVAVLRNSSDSSHSCYNDEPSASNMNLGSPSSNAISLSEINSESVGPSDSDFQSPTNCLQENIVLEPDDSTPIVFADEAVRVSNSNPSSVVSSSRVNEASSSDVQDESKVKDESMCTKTEDNKSPTRMKLDSPNSKDESKSRASSPVTDSTCPICLGTITEECVTENCFHRFCFECLKTWAKQKSSCPLCKKGFKIIMYDIKSESDYKEFTVPINCPSTVTGIARFLGISLPSLGRPARARQNGTRSSSQHRRSIYENDLWVRFTTAERVRESNPRLYRTQVALTHRLMPWLKRELLAIREVFNYNFVVNLIFRHRISSPNFLRNIRNRFRYQLHVEHFIHEFNCFAHSSFDMFGYDDATAQAYGPYVARVGPPVIVDDESSDEEFAEIDLTREEEFQNQIWGGPFGQYHHSPSEEYLQARRHELSIMARHLVAPWTTPGLLTEIVEPSPTSSDDGPISPVPEPSLSLTRPPLNFYRLNSVPEPETASSSSTSTNISVELPAGSSITLTSNSRRPSASNKRKRFIVPRTKGLVSIKAGKKSSWPKLIKKSKASSRSETRAQPSTSRGDDPSTSRGTVLVSSESGTEDSDDDCFIVEEKIIKKPKSLNKPKNVPDSIILSDSSDENSDSKGVDIALAEPVKLIRNRPPPSFPFESSHESRPCCSKSNKPGTSTASTSTIREPKDDPSRIKGKAAKLKRNNVPVPTELLESSRLSKSLSSNRLSSSGRSYSHAHESSSVRPKVKQSHRSHSDKSDSELQNWSERNVSLSSSSESSDSIRHHRFDKHFNDKKLPPISSVESTSMYYSTSKGSWHFPSPKSSSSTSRQRHATTSRKSSHFECGRIFRKTINDLISKPKEESVSKRELGEGNSRQMVASPQVFDGVSSDGEALQPYVHSSKRTKASSSSHKEKKSKKTAKKKKKSKREEKMRYFFSDDSSSSSSDSEVETRRRNSSGKYSFVISSLDDSSDEESKRRHLKKHKNKARKKKSRKSSKSRK